MNTAQDWPQDAILISGGSGFVGTALVRELGRQDRPALVLSREPAAHDGLGVPVLGYDQLPRLAGCHAVVNLAGADIAGGRWTGKRRQLLRNSRLETTRLLCRWVGELARPPEVFVSASAIGYYGDTGESGATETTPPAEGFAAQLCRDWEAELKLPEPTRTVVLRLGVVLGPHGGALRRMLPAFRLGLGGPIGHGRQWMSWIALKDAVGLIDAALREPGYAGAYNAVAPEPVRNRAFAQALGRALHRPALIPVPAAVLRLALGEMSELLLGSQRVLPQRLQAAAYPYACPDLDSALMAALAPGA